MKKLLLLVLFSLAFLSLVAGRAEAAFLNFDQPTVTTIVGSTFQLQIIADSDGQNITSVDAWISYDPTELEVDSVTDGTFFPVVSKNITSGSVYVAGLPQTTDLSSYKTGSGTIGTLNIKSLKAGTVTLSYTCDTTNTYNSSKILEYQSDSVERPNVIACDKNGTSTITISSTDGTSGTTGGTTAGTTTAPTISQLPVTGGFNQFPAYVIPGVMLLILGTAARFLL